jgi:nicotinamidase-related amidase
MNQALIVIDVQNDYFPGGAMELVEMDSAASNCAKLINSFRQRNGPIFHIRHIATRKDATFFIPNTPMPKFMKV